MREKKCKIDTNQKTCHMGGRPSCTNPNLTNLATVRESWVGINCHPICLSLVQG